MTEGQHSHWLMRALVYFYSFVVSPKCRSILLLKILVWLAIIIVDPSSVLCCCNSPDWESSHDDCLWLVCWWGGGLWISASSCTKAIFRRLRSHTRTKDRLLQTVLREKKKSLLFLWEREEKTHKTWNKFEIWKLWFQSLQWSHKDVDDFSSVKMNPPLTASVPQRSTHHWNLCTFQFFSSSHGCIITSHLYFYHCTTQERQVWCPAPKDWQTDRTLTAMSDLVQCGVCWYHRAVIPATDGAYDDKLVSPCILRWMFHVLPLVVLQEGAACCLLLNLKWIKALVFIHLLKTSAADLCQLNPLKHCRAAMSEWSPQRKKETEICFKWFSFLLLFVLSVPSGIVLVLSPPEEESIGLILCFPSLDVFFSHPQCNYIETWFWCQRKSACCHCSSLWFSTCLNWDRSLFVTCWPCFGWLVSVLLWSFSTFQQMYNFYDRMLLFILLFWWCFCRGVTFKLRSHFEIKTWSYTICEFDARLLIWSVHKLLIDNHWYTPVNLTSL